MNTPTEADPDGLDAPLWSASWGAILAVAFLGLGLVMVGRLAAPGGSWWGSLLLVGGGAGAMGLLHWLSVRRVAARLDAVADERDAAKEALDTATDHIETLEEMRTAKSQFLEEISHAFRRPLTLTLGPIDTLLNGRYGALSDDVRTQLRLADRNGTRLLWLVNQLLDLAELETGSMSIAPTEGHLPSFVIRGVRSFEALAERRNVQLRFESTLDDPTAWFDEAKMETMLANLLSSAFRTAEENGSVQVGLRPAADTPSPEHGNAREDESAPALTLVVEHTGAQEVPQPVARGKGEAHGRSVPNPEHISVGLGLRLAEELAGLHGGTLQVDRSIGSKVRYAVRLPRCPPDHDGVASDEDSVASTAGTSGLSPEDESEQGPIALSRKALSSQEEMSESDEDEPAEAPDEDRTTILVIDDNSVICTLVRTQLEPEYRVEEAHDGAEGYTLARTLLPDLVITDVMMPEVDGFELCRKIKKDPDIDHVPVVFLTARADLEDKVEGLDVGADAYLTKPFEPEELIARIENLIATRRTLREAFRTEEAGETSAGEGAGGEGGGVEKAKEALPPTATTSLRDRIEEAIAEHLTDPEFGVSDLAAATALSTSQLRRRMNEVYDRTPVQLIRHRRLEAGARLLQERDDVTIGEVAYAVGFNSQSYFSRSFRDEFGTPPSQYRGEGVAA